MVTPGSGKTDNVRDPFKPKGKPRIKLIVSVGGGCLRAIHTDSGEEFDFDVELFDWDNIGASESADDEAEEDRYETMIKNMKQVN